MENSNPTNKDHYESFHLFLREERFDLAIKEVAKIRKNTRLRREAVKSFLARLSGFLRRVRINPAVGWLQGESADYADAVETAVAVLGDDFYSVLIERCVASENVVDRSLVDLFLEISRNGYLWTDVIKLCLALTAWDLNRPHDGSPVQFDVISEHLSNISQFLEATPRKSISNPNKYIKSGVAVHVNDRSSPFSMDTNEITASSISSQIALSIVCGNLARQGVSVARTSLTEELHNKTVQMKMFREALLLTKHCGVGESAAVFRSYATWIIQMTTLAQEHWDDFFAQIASFLNRLPLLPAEKNWQKECEDPDLFVERILAIIQRSLVDLFSEFGSVADLLTVVDAFHSSSFPVFLQLELILVSPRYFREFLWHLLNQSSAHERIFRYLTDWIGAVNGEPCIATTPSFSLKGHNRVEIPYIGSTLWNAVHDYFSNAGDVNTKEMWEILEHKVSALNIAGRTVGNQDRVDLIYRKKAEYPTNGDEDDSGSESDEEMLTD